eukprot:gnl/TRDRNA2_/TRDRNA2_35321_c0_seq1.p1 gnl/TRDRNA2_/TRDRNA2_35321_c0~~gnl/TRDRNA2_/TRDRNA2_35321_c0_seq1.p1  ORF type:complete len:117 (-),score=17.35 gnl/TRDRNA2_/TRDRNA2_35321_c0_seq1:206-532(-)
MSWRALRVLRLPAVRACTTGRAQEASSAASEAASAGSRRRPALEDDFSGRWEQELPRWRQITSQWGGLMFFGSFMGMAFVAKKVAEYQYDELDRELSKPRRQRAPQYQ